MGIYVRPNGTSAEVLTGLGIITTNRNVLAAAQRGARPTPAQQVQQQRQPAPAARGQAEMSRQALNEMACADVLRKLERVQPIPVPVLTFPVSPNEIANQARNIANSFTPAEILNTPARQVGELVLPKTREVLVVHSTNGFSNQDKLTALGWPPRRRDNRLRRPYVRFPEHRQEYDQLHVIDKINLMLGFFRYLDLRELCPILAVGGPGFGRDEARNWTSWKRDDFPMYPDQIELPNAGGYCSHGEAGWWPTNIFTAGITEQLGPFVRQAWPVLKDFMWLMYQATARDPANRRCGPAVLLAARVQFDRIFPNAHNAYTRTLANFPFVTRLEDLTGPQYPQLRDFYTAIVNETLARQVRMTAALQQADAAAAGLGLLAPRNLTARPMVRPTGNQIAPQLAAQRARAAAEAQRQAQQGQGEQCSPVPRGGVYEVCAPRELA